MANEEQLAILKKGVKAWNKWHWSNPTIQIDLSGAILHGETLREVDLVGANLSRVDLSNADLASANLFGANLRDADLHDADLNYVDFSGADLSDANLSGANLSSANLRDSHLSNANLNGADLYRATLSGADLSHAALTDARCGETIFAANDLSGVKGLETIEHFAPSTIGIDTLFRTKPRLPDIFLRGCGVPEISDRVFTRYARQQLSTFTPALSATATQINVRPPSS